LPAVPGSVSYKCKPLNPRPRCPRRYIKKLLPGSSQYYPFITQSRPKRHITCSSLDFRKPTKAHCTYIYEVKKKAVTYDHRLRRKGDPVRSRILKPQIGRLVVGWVTTSEYLLLYVFYFFEAKFFLPLRICKSVCINNSRPCVLWCGYITVLILLHHEILTF
jgi:hypothetical protein